MAVLAGASLGLAAETALQRATYAPDGQLSVLREAIYRVHSAHPVYVALDADRDGRIDPAILAAVASGELRQQLDRDYRNKIEDEYDNAHQFMDSFLSGAASREFYRKYNEAAPNESEGRHSAIALALIKEEKEPAKRTTGQRWFVREAIEEVTLFDESKTKGQKPATFSLIRDYDTNKTSYHTKGALFYASKIQESKGPFLEQYRGSAGVEINRLDTADDTSETDSLVFRGVLDTKFRAAPDAAAFHYLRFVGSVASDSDFVARAYEWRATYEPYVRGTPIGTGRPLFTRDNDRIRLRLPVHFSYQDQHNGGDEDFFRGGITLQADYMYHLGKDSGLKLSASYGFLSALGGKHAEAELTTASLSYIVNSNYSIEAKFEDGTAPLVKKKVDSLTVGVGVKY